jgi:hypothetical protein
MKSQIGRKLLQANLKTNDPKNQPFLLKFFWRVDDE